MKNYSVFSMLAIVACIFLASCSKSSEVLSSIPASSPVVARIDLDKAADAFDIKMNGDGIVLPEYLKDILGQRLADNQQNVKKLCSSVDRQNMYMFASKNDYIITCLLTDVKTFKSVLTDSGYECRHIDGFDVYNIVSSSLLIRDNQIWIFDSGNADSAVTAVKAQLKLAEEKSLADVDYAADAICSNNTVDLLVDMEATSAITNCMYHAAINAKGNTLEMNTKMIGTKEAIDSLKAIYACQKIGDKLKINAPENALFVAAMGIKGDYDWSTRFEQSGAMLPYQAMAMLQAAAPILKAIDGTVSIVVTTADLNSLIGNLAPSLNISVRAMAKEGAVLELKQHFADMFAKMALKGIEQGDKVVYETGLFRASIGCEGNILCIDFATPTAPTSEATVNMTDKFEKYDAAVMLNIPSLSDFQGLNVPYGLTITGNGSFEKASFKATLTGTDGKFFPTIYNSFK